MADWCPAETCRTRISLTHVMCRPHWGMVPRELQRRVYAAWNRRLKASRELPIGSLGWQEAVDGHVAVKDEAIAHVNARLAHRASG